MLYYSAPAYYRRGYQYIYDENWNIIDCYKQYGIEDVRDIKYDDWVSSNGSKKLVRKFFRGKYSGVRIPKSDT